MACPQRNRIALATRNDVTLFADAPLLAPDYLETSAAATIRSTSRARRITPATSTSTNSRSTNPASSGWSTRASVACLTPASEFSFEPVGSAVRGARSFPKTAATSTACRCSTAGPKYVTAGGDRRRRRRLAAGKATGGCVVDVESNEVIARASRATLAALVSKQVVLLQQRRG